MFTNTKSIAIRWMKNLFFIFHFFLFLHSPFFILCLYWNIIVQQAFISKMFFLYVRLCFIFCVVSNVCVFYFFNSDTVILQWRWRKIFIVLLSIIFLLFIFDFKLTWKLWIRNLLKQFFSSPFFSSCTTNEWKERMNNDEKIKW